jgi:hypothetical protein
MLDSRYHFEIFFVYHMGKTFRFTEKHFSFLKFLMAGLTNGPAYIEAGFRAKTLQSAEVMGCQLLKKLKESEDYHEIIKDFNPYHELGADLAALRRCPDPKIKLGACGLAGKWLGMQKEEMAMNLGFQVIIGGRPAGELDGQEPIKVEAPKKPTSLLK